MRTYNVIGIIAGIVAVIVGLSYMATGPLVGLVAVAGGVIMVVGFVLRARRPSAGR